MSKYSEQLRYRGTGHHYFILASDRARPCFGENGETGYKSSFAQTARTAAMHNEVSYTCTREFDRRAYRAAAFGL